MSRSRIFRPRWFGRRERVALGWILMAVGSVIYCLPRHPHLRESGWHALSHVMLFGGAGLWFFRFGRSLWPLAPLAALAAVLEVVQWQVNGYAHIEYADIAANELGLMLILALELLLRRREAKIRRRAEPPGAPQRPGGGDRRFGRSAE
ncbi:MAG: hypothetical protein KGJ55_09245 [Gammaproteobacteria bacterium]|nr:hypothetical protein [Gammaproteobacteria bacterium]